MKLFTAGVLAGTGVLANKTAISRNNVVLSNKSLKTEWELRKAFKLMLNSDWPKAQWSKHLIENQFKRRSQTDF